MQDELTRELDQFVPTLTASQKRMWKPIGKMVTDLVEAQSRSIDPKSDNQRDQLFTTLHKVFGNINEDKLNRMVENAITRGDAQMFRVFALAAGIDLTEKPTVGTGIGAEVIIIRPYVKELESGDQEGTEAHLRRGTGLLELQPAEGN